MCLLKMFLSVCGWSVDSLDSVFYRVKFFSISFLGDENVLKLGSDTSWHTTCHFHDEVSVFGSLSFFLCWKWLPCHEQPCGEELRPAYTTWVCSGMGSLVPGFLRLLWLWLQPESEPLTSLDSWPSEIIRDDKYLLFSAAKFCSNLLILEQSSSW